MYQVEASLKPTQITQSNFSFHISHLYLESLQYISKIDIGPFEFEINVTRFEFFIFLSRNTLSLVD